MRKLVPELRQKLRDRMYDDFSSFLENCGEVDRIWGKTHPNNRQLRILLTDKDQYLNDIEGLLFQYNKNIEALLELLE